MGAQFLFSYLKQTPVRPEGVAKIPGCPRGKLTHAYKHTHTHKDTLTPSSRLTTPSIFYHIHQLDPREYLTLTM